MPILPAVNHDGLWLQAARLVLSHALQEVEEGGGRTGDSKVRP